MSRRSSIPNSVSGGTRRGRVRGRRAIAASAAAAATALALVLGGAGPAAAAPALHLSFHGRVAIAGWTTCPEPRLGDRCIDTVVIASDARTYENSDRAGGGHFLHDSGDRVVLQRFWYEMRLFDGVLSPIPTRESFGGTDVGVDVRIDNRLRTATATAASIPMNTTDYGTGQDSSETASVRVTWTPTGPLTAIRERDRVSNGDVFFRSGTTGSTRDAVATGLVGGSRIPGVPTEETSLFSGRQVELTVVRGLPLGG